MTSPSTPTRLPIDPNHVALQFARRGDLADAQFLYAEIAQRMDQRLKLIRLQPTVILDAGCGGRAAALRGRKGPHHPLERHRISVVAEFGSHRDHLLDVATALLVFVWVTDRASDTHDPAWVDHDRISAKAGRDAGLHLAPCVEVDARLFQLPVGMASDVRRRAGLDRHGEFRAGE